MPKVYVSSTYSDLVEERAAVAKAIQRLGYHAICMEDYVAADERPLEKCLNDVRACAAYVGIFAWRYGFVPENQKKSITQLEYEAAKDAGIPCLLFLLEENAPWPRPRMDRDPVGIETLREALGNERIVSFFQDAGDLSGLAAAALANELGPAEGATAAIPVSGEAHYLNTLITRCSPLDLAQVDPTWSVPGAEPSGRDVGIADVFTTLYLQHVTRKPDQSIADAVLGKRPEDDPQAGNKREQEAHTPVQAIEAAGAVQRLVVLGQPGGGKSTLVNYMAERLARLRLNPEDDDVLLPGWSADDRPLPVRIILRRFAAWKPEKADEGTALHVWEYIQHMLEQWACGETYDSLKRELQEKGGVIFFDGLDEVSETDEAARRSVIKRAIEAFAAPLEHCKVIITCREYAYQVKEAQSEQDSWILAPNHFPVVNLALFNLEQIRAFNHAWYKTVGPHLDWPTEKCEQEANRLADAVGLLPYLGELAQYPLLLTLMAQLHGRDGYLPEDRADLYRRSVDLLLAHWENRLVRDEAGGRTVEQGLVMRLGIRTETLRTLLAQVAFEAHQRQESESSREEKAANIRREELRQAINAEVDDWNKAEEALDYIQHRTGLLIARDNYTYAFPHRTFQEYLAARHVLQQAEPDLLLRDCVRRDLDWWREVFLLTAGDSKIPSQVASMVDSLLPKRPGELAVTSERISFARLAAQALWESGFEKHVEKERADEPGRFTTTFERIQAWLLAGMQATEILEPKVRVDVGNALARLGDPRKDVLEAKHMAFSYIPPGAFLMGDTTATMKRLVDEGYGEQWVSWESPQHEVTIDYGYWMGRYPVTVGQFNLYLADKKIAPKNAQSQGPLNHPVVNVSWDEAASFCEWLSEKLTEEAQKRLSKGMVATEHQLFCKGLVEGKLYAALPGEAEWEKAARGAAGYLIYPWGDLWDVNRCNNRELGINTTSPVGCFPAGCSPYGIEELAGNVVEWGRDWFDEALYQQWEGLTVVNPQGPEKGEKRVLRGGSFNYSQRRCRCSVRGWYAPYDHYYDWGFRVVVLPSDVR